MGKASKNTHPRRSSTNNTSRDAAWRRICALGFPFFLMHLAGELDDDKVADIRKKWPDFDSLDNRVSVCIDYVNSTMEGQEALSADASDETKRVFVAQVIEWIKKDRPWAQQAVWSHFS